MARREERGAVAQGAKTGGRRSVARDPRTWVRPELRSLSAYHLDQVECRFKLDQNEVPWDFPRRLKAQALERLARRNWAFYPDFHADALRQALARHHGWPWRGVLVGNGSNELLGVALEALTGPGREVLGIVPSFGLYEMFIRRAGARPRFVDPRPDLQLPLEELHRQITRDPTRPLLLCSPNNPTGAAATPQEIGGLLEKLEAPLLLDNAYGEFCRYDYRPLLRHHSHLVLFRTLSKAWSLGGMRLGYLLADPSLVAELIKVKLPYNLNHAAAVVGEVALENRHVARRRIELLVARRDQWREMLAAHGLEVFPSEGNFLLVRAPSVRVWKALRQGLDERGILVRQVGHYPGLERCLRVAVGDGRALRSTGSALREILEERS